MNIEEIIRIKGEPDDVIICDPTRGNEAEGAVIIYKSGGKDNKGEIIYEDVTLNIADIVDITVKLRGCGGPRRRGLPSPGLRIWRRNGWPVPAAREPAAPR